MRSDASDGNTSAADAISGPFPDRSHNHKHCIDEAFSRAERLCADRGLRLTTLRRAVLKIIWEGHHPAGAYDILDRLKEQGRSAAPMTVYRTLDFLMEHGLVHRLASRNAFVGCDHPGDRHRGQFLMCRDCGMVAEMADPRITAAIHTTAASTGFAIETPVVEVTGLCGDCVDNAGSSPDES
ncbi:MAG: transcriptional repressor [Alphaproteobacteria bacterium]|nr:transcriptional repressor [Alphaproteobacteria bacterium]